MTAVVKADVYEEIGWQIRWHRQRAGITQETLATAVGLSRTSIVNIEMGRQATSLHHVIAIADALGCSICELLDSFAERGP